MTTTITSYPKQRLSYKEKSKDDFKWAKDTIDALLSNHPYFDYASLFDNRPDKSQLTLQERMLINYDLFNNVIDQRVYERDCNLLGLNVNVDKDELKPYNKIPNKIQALLGDEYTRPFTFKAVLINSNGISFKNMERTQKLQERLNERINEYISSLQAQYFQQGMDPKQAEKAVQEALQRLTDPEEYEDLSQKKFSSSSERLASRILNWLRLEYKIKGLMKDAFKHGLISAHEIVYIGEKGGEPYISVVNPVGFFYHKSPDVKYIQDGLYAGYQSYMTINEVLDAFELTKEQIEKLTQRYAQPYETMEPSSEMKYPDRDLFYQFQTTAPRTGQYGEVTSLDIPVAHVEWRSQAKVYIATLMGENGEEDTVILSEDFKIPDGAQKVTTKVRGITKTKYIIDNIVLEERWIEQVWEGVRIDFDIYTNIGPKRQQYRRQDNLNRVTLGYHGIVYENTNSEPISLLDRMRPYQELYFFVMHKLKQLIAKDKGKVFHLDLSMIPEKIGLEKTLYYLDQLDLDLFNPLKNAEQPGAAQRGKISTATDRSNMQHIMNYVNLLAYLDQQISDISGIPKAREGQTPTQQAVTNAQQDLRQSALVTEATYFAPHFELWTEILSNMVNLTIDLWKGKNIVKQYVLDTGDLETLEIRAGDLENAEIGIYISNIAKDLEIFYTLKSFAQAMFQNQLGSIKDIVKILKADSSEEIEAYLEQQEKKREKMAQAQQEQEMKQLEMQLNAQREEREDQQAHEIELEEIKSRTEIEKALISAKSKEPGELDYAKLKLEYDKLKAKVDVDNKKLENDRKKLQRTNQNTKK